MMQKLSRISGSFVPAAPVVHPRTGARLHRTMNQGVGLWTEIG